MERGRGRQRTTSTKNISYRAEKDEGRHGNKRQRNKDRRENVDQETKKEKKVVTELIKSKRRK
jgi:hypothetical protein